MDDDIMQEEEMKKMMEDEEDRLNDSEKTPVSSKSDDYAGINYNTAITKTVYLHPRSPPLSTCRRICTKTCCGSIF